MAIYAEDATVIMRSKDTDAFGIEGRTDTTLPYTAPRTRRVGGHLDNFDALKHIVTGQLGARRRHRNTNAHMEAGVPT